MEAMIIEFEGKEYEVTESVSVSEILSRWGSVDWDYYSDSLADSEYEMPIPWRMSWEFIFEICKCDYQYDAVRDSIANQGLLRPFPYIIENEIKVLRDGHHRMAAVVELGIETVPIFNFTDMGNGEILSPSRS